LSSKKVAAENGQLIIAPYWIWEEFENGCFEECRSKANLVPEITSDPVRAHVSVVFG
jgi:hypothetical protein